MYDIYVSSCYSTVPWYPEAWVSMYMLMYMCMWTEAFWFMNCTSALVAKLPMRGISWILVCMCLCVCVNMYMICVSAMQVYLSYMCVYIYNIHTHLSRAYVYTYIDRHTVYIYIYTCPEHEGCTEATRTPFPAKAVNCKCMVCLYLLNNLMDFQYNPKHNLSPFLTSMLKLWTVDCTLHVCL
jgi:hypothetical protein